MEKIEEVNELMWFRRQWLECAKVSAVFFQETKEERFKDFLLYFANESKLYKNKINDLCTLKNISPNTVSPSLTKQATNDGLKVYQKTLSEDGCF
jgi:hypothetical protein